MTYRDAVRRIVNDYRERKTAFEQYENDLFENNERFRESELSLRELVLRRAKGENVPQKAFDEATAENKKIRMALHLTPPAPRCPKCADTGLVNGKYCDCVVALAVSTSDEIGIPLHDFESVDYAVYGKNADTYRKLFGDVSSICRRYPDNKKRCIVLSGTAGNGKTYLAGCAAQKILSRGMSVMALTAFAANNRFLRYHTTFDDQKTDFLQPLLDCTLLIIDDLGTESILKNVTVEYLYQILNERNTTGKLTLFTTNLTPDGLLARYGERIYSRLFDKSLSYATFLKTPDIRNILQK